MNSVNVIGNVTKDIELRYTPQGKAVSVFSVAINEKFGETKQTHFIDVEVWGKTAEVCNQYLKKGSKVAVSGSLKQQRWEKDGQKRSKVMVLAQRVDFLNKPETEEFDFND